MSAPRPPDVRSGEAGFTLLEMMIATMLMVFILVALATVTAQWLPNWNRGMARMERDERLAFALNRVVEDLSVAEFVPANTEVKTPYFEGSELSVSFVRTAVGPNSRPGLEFIRFAEVADMGGPSLVRQHAAFVPLPADVQVRFGDPIVLIRAPYRVAFAYADANGDWQRVWRDGSKLPVRIRISVRDGVTEQTLAVSTTALTHADTPAACVTAKDINQCENPIVQPGTGDDQNSATQSKQVPPGQ